MTILHNLPPGLLLILGALLLPLLPGRLRNLWVIALAAGACWQVAALPENAALSLPFLDFQLELLRVDRWSKIFGYIYTLSAFAAFVYGYYEKDTTQLMAALLYIGSALMVIFAGDLITLYIFWEVMAITSALLILSRRTKKAYQAAYRYVLVHVFGGLVLLAGIVLWINDTGSITFDRFDPAQATLATWLILAGFLVNAAALPLSSWLPDAYPESTVLGGVILSAYTSKTAVYALVRGFPGWEILIWLGCAMTIYGIIYALLENDMRRILAYSIINQVGFMVCGVGIGTALALNGTVAHAFCHIIYKALLWMSAGAVLHQTGKSKCTELGGLYNTMPWTLALGGIGALAISAVPFTSGFTSKTIILAAATNQHLFWPWLILEIASAGVFLHAGIKFPYFVFFGEDKGLRPPEAPKCMLLGMTILAFFCVYLGLFPARFYDLLPNADLVKEVMPSTFYDIYVSHFAQVVTQSQLLIFSALVFFLFLPLLKRTDTISLDFDWFYRKGARLLYQGLDLGLNHANALIDRTMARGLSARLSAFCANGPANCFLLAARPYYRLMGMSVAELHQREARFHEKFRLSNFSVASTAIFTVGLVLVLFFC